MSRPMTDTPGLKPDWIILLLTSIGIAATLGRPIGFAVAILAVYVHDGSVSEKENTLIIWLHWMSWVAPLVVGAVPFAIGAVFLKWKARKP